MIIPQVNMFRAINPVLEVYPNYTIRDGFSKEQYIFVNRKYNDQVDTYIRVYLNVNIDNV